MEIDNLFTAARPFSAARLRVARQRRKMTMKALAERIGVNSMTMTRMEKGTYSPDVDLFTAISNVLHMPYDFFYDDDCDLIDIDAVSFRSKRSMTSITRDKVLATGSIASVNISSVFSTVSKDIPLDLLDLSEYRDRPATAADIMRHHWKLSNAPITNVIKLLEAKGIRIFWVNEESSSADAVSFWRNDNAYILMNSCVCSGERCRFNAAHELAHLVLHRKESVVEGYDIEREADIFASAFLLDRDQFYVECPRSLVLSNFYPLKRRWGVSIQAMIRRGRDLGIFKEYQYERAFKEISSRGWRKSEPNELDCEESYLHRRIFDSLWEKGIFPQDIAQRTNLNLELDLLEMIPVAADYVDQAHRNAYVSRISAKLPEAKRGSVIVRDPSLYKPSLPLSNGKIGK